MTSTDLSTMWHELVPLALADVNTYVSHLGQKRNNQEVDSKPELNKSQDSSSDETPRKKKRTSLGENQKNTTDTSPVDEDNSHNTDNLDHDHILNNNFPPVFKWLEVLTAVMETSDPDLFATLLKFLLKMMVSYL